jgi:hypothetical protein
VYNREIDKLYNEEFIAKVIEVGFLRWLGQLFRIKGKKPCFGLTPCKPEGTRRLFRLPFKWLDSVQEDLEKVDVRN